MDFTIYIVWQYDCNRRVGNSVTAFTNLEKSVAPQDRKLICAAKRNSSVQCADPKCCVFSRLAFSEAVSNAILGFLLLLGNSFFDRILIVRKMY